jgi:uncharacterized membrane protein YwzB
VFADLTIALKDLDYNVKVVENTVKGSEDLLVIIVNHALGFEVSRYFNSSLAFTGFLEYLLCL